MKISLRFKFICSYLILILAMFILLNTYGHSRIYNKLVEQEETMLYEEADLIAKRYVNNIYVLNESLPSLRKQFHSLETLTNTRFWLVDSSGVILLDSNDIHNKEKENINYYDTSYLSNQSVIGNTPKGLIEGEHISVIYPLSVSMKTYGYIILLSPLERLNERTTNVIDTIIICYIILLILVSAIFFYLYQQTVRPLKDMTRAAKEYANGHFDYPIVKMTGHDQADLSAAIRYLADKMSSMNDYQKNFIANVSHDFRSPLTSIKGYTEALADGTIPPEMQEKYLNIILFETERLTKLTSNLLQLNQFENNGMMMEISTFDINQTIKNMSAPFEQRCQEKKISLKLVFDQKERLVDADLHKIEQVIQNLIDNAVKFSHNDSVIEIHTSEKNHKIFVSIKDHGIGIPKESIRKIWNRFYKTDLSRGKDKKGTGLGLSITREIIEAHGENINVISTEGVGTEFIFTLPAHKKGEEH